MYLFDNSVDIFSKLCQEREAKELSTFSSSDVQHSCACTRNTSIEDVDRNIHFATQHEVMPGQPRVDDQLREVTTYTLPKEYSGDHTILPQGHLTSLVSPFPQHNENSGNQSPFDGSCPAGWTPVAIRNMRITPNEGDDIMHGCLVNVDLCYIFSGGELFYYVKGWSFADGGNGCAHHWENGKPPADFDQRVKNHILNLHNIDNTFDAQEVPPSFLRTYLSEVSSDTPRRVIRIGKAICLRNYLGFSTIACGTSACVTIFEAWTANGLPKSKLVFHGKPPREYYSLVSSALGMGYATPLPGKGISEKNRMPADPFDCRSFGPKCTKLQCLE